ncbi:MAG: ABC transporter permease [Alphaproteobacteria bacterium]
MDALIDNWLASTPEMAAPLLIAALGLIINERAGVLNLGAEGLMMVGALAGVMGAYHAGTPWVGVAAAVVAAGVVSALFAFIVVVLRADQVITGLTVVAFGAGLTGLIGPPYSQTAIAPFGEIDLGFLTAIPYVGRMIFGQDVLFYLAIALAALTWWLLYRSQPGLVLRAVGENPQAADAAGADVQGVRIAAVVAGGVLCGLAGADLSLAASQTWVEGMTGGRGWIAVALVIFARWSPWRAILGALLFGSIEALIPRIQATGANVPTFLLKMLPYLATLAVLIFTAVVRRSVHAAPAALGQAYAREDRRD